MQHTESINHCESKRGPINQSLSSAELTLTASHVYWSIQLLGDSLNHALSIWSPWQCNSPFPESPWASIFESLVISYNIIGAVSSVWMHTEQASSDCMPSHSLLANRQLSVDKERMLLYVWGCWINKALPLCGLRVWVIGLMKMDGLEVSTFSEQQE